MLGVLKTMCEVKSIKVCGFDHITHVPNNLGSLRISGDLEALKSSVDALKQQNSALIALKVHAQPFYRNRREFNLCMGLQGTNEGLIKRLQNRCKFLEDKIKDQEETSTKKATLLHHIHIIFSPK